MSRINTDTKKLHLGCFDIPVEGWINTDITPHIWISRIPFAAQVLHFAGQMSAERLAQHRDGVFQKLTYLDVAKKFPYPSESFHAIFTCHMLEHLYPPAAIHCIQECRRVLCRDGVLRIGIPDLDRLVSDYDPQTPDLFLQSIFEYGRGLQKNSHHWHYNFNSLKTALLNAGFSKAERCVFKVGACPDVEKMDTRPESLFVEAFK
jgi:SAM-dependent methyltransferase